MNAKDVIKMQMDVALHVLKTYVSDLSDADLLLRPGKGCNHLAWQIGHLIAASHPMMHAGQFVTVRRQLDKPVLI